MIGLDFRLIDELCGLRGSINYQINVASVVSEEVWHGVKMIAEGVKCCDVWAYSCVA